MSANLLPMTGEIASTASHLVVLMVAMMAIVSLVPLFAARVNSGKIPPHMVRRLAWTAVLCCAVSLAINVVAGPYILKLLQLPLPAFGIAGGYIAWVTGKELVHEKLPEDTEEPKLSGRERLRASMTKAVGSIKHLVRAPKEMSAQEMPLAWREVATWVVVPFSFPLVAGPGIGSVLITQTSTFKGWPQYAGLAVAFVAVLCVLWVALRYSPKVMEKLSVRARFIINKVNGVIIMGYGALMFCTNPPKLIVPVVVAVLRQQGVLPPA